MTRQERIERAARALVSSWDIWETLPDVATRDAWVNSTVVEREEDLRVALAELPSIAEIAQVSGEARADAAARQSGIPVPPKPPEAL